MVKKKIRWVPKGTAKSKGYRKTGRTRRTGRKKVYSKDKKVTAFVNKNGYFILIAPPVKRMKSPLPDKWFTEFEFDLHFNIPAGTISNPGAGAGPGLNGNYATFAANALNQPFNTQPANTNAILLNATGAGTGQGLAATYAGGWAQTNQAYNSIVFQSMFQRYIIYSFSVFLEVYPQVAGDSVEVSLAALNQGWTIPTTTVAHSTQNIKQSVTATCTFANTAQKKNKLSLRGLRIQDLSGYNNLSLDEILARSTYDAPCNANPLSLVGPIISMQMMDNAVQGGAMPCRIKLVQKILYWDPIQQSA